MIFIYIFIKSEEILTKKCRDFKNKFSKEIKNNKMMDICFFIDVSIKINIKILLN